MYEKAAEPKPGSESVSRYYHGFSFRFLLKFLPWLPPTTDVNSKYEFE